MVNFTLTAGVLLYKLSSCVLFFSFVSKDLNIVCLVFYVNVHAYRVLLSLN